MTSFQDAPDEATENDEVMGLVLVGGVSQSESSRRSVSHA